MKQLMKKSRPDIYAEGQKKQVKAGRLYELKMFSKHVDMIEQLDLLVDEKSRFEVIPDIVDEGRKCVGLRITGSVTPAMSLYFDQETLLLRRLDWRNDFYRFSEWKDYDGLRYASRTVIFKTKSGKPWFFHDITELERLAQLPTGLDQPKAAK